MKESPFLRRAIKPQRPAKAPLSRDQIVQAALRIVRVEGIDGVSMRRIAAEFDTGPSSLYAHVANKDELLQLMFDEICGLMPVPAVEPGRWKEQILEMARDGHRVLLDHYDLARAALATIPTGPNALRISEAMLGMMLAGGLPPRVASWAMDRIFLYITADAYEMSIWRGEVGAAGTDRESFVAELGNDLMSYFEQLPEDEFPHLRKHAKDMVGGGTEERFELGLAMLVDGLDKYVTK
ncbi:TetR/AcrR family transcriptional regulator [Actinoplanes sp. CA-142083]|uniref:TetR/AcrR family transcriptional regulator n=1 Tax=Actinoplanes sp. CA-142083 TaxID=3239903 RepID=UPI003D8B6694